jgi:hypothetical protein
MADTRQLCEGKTKDGQPCRGKAVPGSRFCPFHDPGRAEATAEGRRRGGKARSKPAAVLAADTPDVALDSVRDVVTFLAGTVNQVRRGQVDPRVGNCLGVLCGHLLKALEDDLTQELAEVRKLIEGRSHGNGIAPGTGASQASPGRHAGPNGDGGQAAV